MKRNKRTNQYAEEMRWVFSFDLKEVSKEECLTKTGREFQISGPVYWTDLSPRVILPILRTRKIRVSAAEQREREEK